MRIGIDLDDTICNTSELLQIRLDEYAHKKGLEPLVIINDEDLRNTFFHDCLKDIYLNVKIKKNAKEVIQRLKNRGNEIYYITARSNDYVDNITDAYQLCKIWLEKNELPIDGIITSCYGENKKRACIDNKIDLIIDDDLFNIRKVQELGIKYLLFDDKEKYLLKDGYVTSWIEVEKYIERIKKL